MEPFPKIKKDFEKMKKSEHSLGFHLCLEKSELSDVYEQMLEELKSEEFFFKKENPGIRFDKSFDNSLAESICQGLVAGTTGSLKWESRDGSRTVVDFIIGLIHCKKATKKLKFRSNKVVEHTATLHFVPGYLHLPSSKGTNSKF